LDPLRSLTLENRRRQGDLHLDNAFPPQVRAIEGEGEGLKLGDGEEGFEFFCMKERGSRTDAERKKA